YRAQQQLARIERDLTLAREQGLVTVERQAQVMALAQQHIATQVASANRSTALSADHIRNMTFQMQGLGGMVASGNAPFALLAQQGLMIASSLGPMGAAGAVRALGTSITAFVTNPVNLAVL